MKRSTAIRILDLAGYAYHAQNGTLLSQRVDALMEFHKRHPEVKIADIEIETNNNWSTCPAPKSAKIACKIGGTTYQYMVWAVVRSGHVVPRILPFSKFPWSPNGIQVDAA